MTDAASQTSRFETPDAQAFRPGDDTAPGSAALRIAVIGPTHPHKGGVAAHTTMLAHHLDDAGHDVMLVSWSHLYPSKLHQVAPYATRIDLAGKYRSVHDLHVGREILPLYPEKAPARLGGRAKAS